MKWSKVSSPVAFSMLRMFYSYYVYLAPIYFHPPAGIQTSFLKYPYSFAPLNPVATYLHFSLWVYLPWRSQMTCKLSCLAFSLTHVVALNSSSLFSVADSIPLYRHTAGFISPSTGGHVACFCLVAVVNGSFMNKYVCGIEYLLSMFKPRSAVIR